MNDIPTAPVAAPAQPLDPKAGIEQNDRKYPRLGSTIRQIWDWLDAFMEARSTASSRAELLTNLEPAGFHPATLATQYAAWRRFHGIVGTVADPAKADKAAAKAAEKAAKEAEKATKAEAAAAEKAAKAEAAAAAKAAKEAEKAAKAEAKAAEKAAAAAAKLAAAQATAPEVPAQPE